MFARASAGHQVDDIACPSSFVAQSSRLSRVVIHARSSMSTFLRELGSHIHDRGLGHQLHNETPHGQGQEPEALRPEALNLTLRPLPVNPQVPNPDCKFLSYCEPSGSKPPDHKQNTADSTMQTPETARVWIQAFGCGT